MSNYIIHCSTCKSRSDFDTDWNGHLVEYLNHKCECPLPTFDHLEKPNECQRCGSPCNLNAKWCADCAYLMSVERVAEGHRRRSAGRKAAPLPMCACGKPARAHRAKRCLDCQVKLMGLGTKAKREMRAA